MKQQSGYSIASLIIGAGIAAVSVYFGAISTKRLAKSHQTGKARDSTIEMLKLMNRDISNRFDNHRQDEQATFIPNCDVERRFFNYLRGPTDRCDGPAASQHSETLLLTSDPGLANASSLTPAQLADRRKQSSKVVLEELYEDGGVSKIRRTEYETVCVSLPTTARLPYTTLNKLPVITSGSGDDYDMRGDLEKNGCIERSYCNQPHQTLGILMRTHSDWNDDDDLRGDLPWGSEPATEVRAECYPKHILEPNAAMNGCRLKSNLTDASSSPAVAAICAWTDDLDEPSLLFARLWGLYPNDRGTLSKVRENVRAVLPRRFSRAARCAPDPAWGDPMTFPPATTPPSPLRHNTIWNFTNDRLSSCFGRGLPIGGGYEMALLRSRNASEKGKDKPFNQGIEEEHNLSILCNLYGYDNYLSSTCEDPGPREQNRCNWTSPHNNSNTFFNNAYEFDDLNDSSLADTTLWQATSSGSYQSWIMTITCEGKQ